MEANLLGSDGFIQSFTIDEQEASRAFFDLHGFVVVRDVLPTDQITKSISEVWDQVEAASAHMVEQRTLSWSAWLWSFLGYPVSVSRDAPASWGRDFWPFSRHGIAQTIAVGQQLFENRQSPAVFSAFQNVMQTENLLVSLDRFGLILPGPATKPWLHWDLNPWFASGVNIPSYEKPDTIVARKQMLLERWQRQNSAEKILLTEYNSAMSLIPPPVQGLIALKDAQLDDGGFMCIPGFHHQLRRWAQSNPLSSEWTKVDVPEGDAEFADSKVVRVPVRAGSLLIWSSALPHCNYQGQALRMCQYLKMIPEDQAYHHNPTKSAEVDSLNQQILQERAAQVSAYFPPTFQPSVIGDTVFGLRHLN